MPDALTVAADGLGPCPFCGRELAIDRINCGVLHGLPTCVTFDQNGPIEFLVEVRKQRELVIS